MSDPGRPDPARGWMAVEKLLLDDEAERIEKLSGDELRAELRAKGVDPASVPTGEELLQRVRARAAREGKAAPRGAAARRGQVAASTKRPARVFWLLAAAFVVAIVVVAVVKGPEVIAHFRAPSIGPDKETLPAAGRRALAEKLRYDAIGNCEQGAWGTCQVKLDQAARLDPAGELEPRVRKMRADIENAERPAPQEPDKPGP